MSFFQSLQDMSHEQAAWNAEQSLRAVQPAMTNQPPLCVDCPREARRLATSSCTKCNQVYCDACWADRGPHMRGDSEHERVPIHGSTMEDLTTAFRRLEQVFYETTTTDVNEDQQHHLILETLWLAVVHSENTQDSPLFFNERPRFGDIMGEHQNEVQRQLGDRNLTHYPRLISFVGNTGAGKSSLIKVLISHLWDSSVTEGDLNGVVVPIAGTRTDTLPTSSDIHLYYDAKEARENPECPLLFADCEGFEAANYSAAARSRAESMRNMEREAPVEIQLDATKLNQWGRKAFDRAMRFIKRNLLWTGSNIDRSKAVEELFPRVVYNISDVVVYVVAETNLKSMGKILEKLVKWSQKAEMSAVNRMSFPSLIILINQCDPANTKEWSSEKTTDQILEENAYLMEDNETIRNRKDELASFELPHNNIKDILNNSYAAVRFLRLPTARNTPRLSSQFKEFYAMIHYLTNATHNDRRERNMLLSSEQLHHLYKLTFDHFSKSTSPFDFMEAFFKVHPSPAELSGNFFKLLQATFETAKHGNQMSNHQPFADKVIDAAVPLICSTIAIDSRRRHFPGSLSEIFRGDTAEFPSSNSALQDGSYENSVHRALQDFADSILPCGHTFTGSSGEEERICVNGKKAHTQIHQGSEGWHQDANGVRFGSGPFNPSFEQYFKERWAYALANGLNSLESMRLPDLWDIHRNAIRHLYDLLPGVNLKRLPSCVWCMRNFPCERLSCGHWICSTCVVEIGERAEEDDRVFIIKLCDQHAGPGQELNPPLEFLDLPKTVGRRLLSLDEGGARGILQLRLLGAVQDKLGKEIAIQDCFDLIGGTGIGGINALVLGINRWDISKTIKEFNRLVPRAFVRQDSQNFFTSLFWPQKTPYSLAGLIQSIQEAIGEDTKRPMAASMSYGTATGGGPIRVFVTSTRKGSGGVLLTNYCRQAVDNNQDQDFKQSQTNQEIPKYAEFYSVSEAAKATASFEPFFGPYNLNPGNDLHVGGAQDFACPAETTFLEAQSLWPHMLSTGPDILVSIGCGHNDQVALTNSNDCTDTGAIWNKVFGRISQQQPGRYIRLSPKFSKESLLPSADDVSFLTNVSLQDRALNQDDIGEKIDRITRRLISTTFYFDKISSRPCQSGVWTIYGHIRCRFRETSEIVKAFGSKISSYSNPRFVCESEEVWRFDRDALKVMKEQGRFRAPYNTGSCLEIRSQSEDLINIQFMADDFSQESISGSNLL